ncbi:MAG: hypothetical protein IJX89_05345 [Alphaproteobacteria bacterium]|nr:hypothetical protein [Alphaproteobacteria bacterium]
MAVGYKTPNTLIHELDDFYRQNPDYRTSVVSLAMLANILANEMGKFVSRPRRVVIEVKEDEIGNVLGGGLGQKMTGALE